MKIELHEEDDPLTTRVHVGELRTPAEAGERVKLTVPVTAMGAPVPVSVTIAVQDDTPLIPRVDGTQLSAVEVVRAVTTTMLAVPELELWSVSPPYEAMTAIVPVEIPAVYVTEQVPPERRQVEEPNAPSPAGAVNDTVPVGTSWTPWPESATVAVQVDCPFITTYEGAHAVVVVLGLTVAATVVEAELVP